MDELLTEVRDHVLTMTLNRIKKHNAFDDHLLALMQQAITTATEDTQVHVIVLKANGQHFSAGADLAWMQRMVSYSMEENETDAMQLAQVMSSLYHCPKPTVACVQGAAYGGGVGLVAACDIAIASTSARFCFSEVKLGLIPAVISPYVIKAIGERASSALFMTAEEFDAPRAVALNLIHRCVREEELNTVTDQMAHHLAKLPVEAVRDAKALVREVAPCLLDSHLQQRTAHLIAKKRISAEGQEKLNAFLQKT